MDKTLLSEVTTRLDALAAKLGVASGQMWEILVTQARLEALENGFFAALGLIMMLSFWRLWKYTWTPVEGFKNRWGLWAHNCNNDAALFGSGISLSLLGLTGPILFLANTTSTLKYLLNPEYYALKEILSIFQ